MATLEIGEIYIKRIGDKSRCCSDITWGDRSRTLWFEVERSYEEYLCTERIDGFLVALLPYAMLENLDIHSRWPVSERLLYQLKTILIPTLSANIPELHPIDVDTKSDGRLLESKNGVGTALTCGVDSFYTVLKHIAPETEGFKLTHLTYFNILNSVQWKKYGEDNSRDFYNARRAYVKKAAQELGLETVNVDSNFDLFYHDFELLTTFTFRTLGTVLALQKLFKKYYWSSGHSLSQFQFSIDDMSHIDLLHVHCFSNENTEFYSTGSEVNRLQKAAYISNFPITYKYLNVCWRHLHNCTDKCDKCKRTILELYVLGKLQLYNKVFDIEKFNQNINEYLAHLYVMRIGEQDNRFYHETYDYYIMQGMKIPLKAKIIALKLVYEAIKNKLKEL